jgi:alkaline phosphatase
MLQYLNEGHLPFAIDHDPSANPSLPEMTETALRLMTEATRHSEQGFFMLVEGSRIDMAAHNNDPAAHAHEILAYQQTVALVKKYVDEHPGTVMLSVSDHETGGFTVGRQVGSDYPEYKWNPEVVARVRNSSEVIASLVFDCPEEERENYVRNVIFPVMLGVEGKSFRD